MGSNQYGSSAVKDIVSDNLVHRHADDRVQSVKGFVQQQIFWHTAQSQNNCNLAAHSLGAGGEFDKDIERFTVGRDREMDLYLAKHDVLGSMAHITMLESIGLLTKEELDQLLVELKSIYASAEKGEFVIEDGVEDVHSQVELMLTRRLGDIGKKIHSGRSRNDQVLLDLKLFTRTQIKEIAEAVEQLFHVLIMQSERYKDVLMPGYTHTS